MHFIYFPSLKDDDDDIIANEPTIYGLDYIIKSPTIIRVNDDGDTLSLPYVRVGDKITVKDPNSSNILLRADLIANKTLKPCFEAYSWIKPKSTTSPWGNGISFKTYCTQEPNLLTFAQSIKTKNKLTVNDTIIVANYYGIYEQ